MSKHTPGPWREGARYGAIVADHPVEGMYQGADAVEYYGGHVVAESVAPCNRALIAAAPEMLEILTEIEYVNADEEGMYSFCPKCGESDTRGHLPTCSLGRVLAKVRGEAAK